MDNYTEGINAAWEEIEKTAKHLKAETPEERWEGLKQEFYGSNTVVIVEGGIIDFSVDNYKRIVNIGKTSYDEYLDIAHSSLGHQRTYFEQCFYNGTFGNFKGKIQRKTNERILFEKIDVSGDYGDGTCFDGKEQHVWMSITGFEPYSIGDNLRFDAEVYRYLRTGHGKTIDYALRSPDWIQKIDEYELPSDDELLMQQIDSIICETCMFNGHCYDICIANEEWRQQMRKALAEMAKTR